MGSHHLGVSIAAACYALVPLSLVGCYWPPDDDEQFEESVIITSRDENANFGQFQTFYLRPDIRVLDEASLDAAAVGGGDGTLPPETLPIDNAAPLLRETQAQLVARGYVSTDVKEEADLAVELVYARTIFTDYYCYYWSDWSYWGYPGYYYYYPYSCDTVAWRSGMLVTNVVDLSSVVPDAPPGTNGTLLRGVWFSGIYGAEVESTDFVEQRAVDGIDQSFKQSPYFSVTPPVE